MRIDRVPVLEAEKLYGTSKVSVEACREMVLAFNKEPSSALITFLGTPMKMGQVKSVIFDEDTKTIYADIELEIDVYASIEAKRTIDTPQGSLVVEGIIKSGVLVPKIERKS